MAIIPDDFSPYDYIPDSLRGAWDGRQGPPGPIPGLPGIVLRRPQGLPNFVRFILTHPCADPWFALISTFAPAALNLGWTLFAPDWQDVLRGFAEDYSALPGQRRRRRKGHGPARALPLNGVIPPHRQNKALRLTLFVTSPLERLGWWWLVWNATDQFFIDWHTLLLRVDYCSREGDGGLMQRENPLVGVNFNPVPFPVSLPILTKQLTGITSGPFGCSVLPGTYHIIFEGSFPRNVLNNPLPGCRLRIEVSGLVLGPATFESEEFTLPPGGEGGTVLMARVTILSFTNNISWYTVGLAGVGASVDGKASIIVMRETAT